MSGDILLDTNILLYFLKGNENVKKFFLDYNPIISFISELEILLSPELSEHDKLNIQQLLSRVEILSYSERYKKTILQIRSAKRLKLPDAIIAATAISLDLTLVTADKALKNIPFLNTLLLPPQINE